MTKRWSREKRTEPGRAVSSRADWRTFVAQARECAKDAAGQISGGEAELRLMTLGRRARHASAAVLDRDAGMTMAETGRAFLKLVGAFAHLATPPETRRAMAPTVEAVGVFLDDQLHELNTAEFQRAHAGRPEVWN